MRGDLIFTNCPLTGTSFSVVRSSDLMKYRLSSYSFDPNQASDLVTASRNPDFRGYLPPRSQGRKREDLCSVVGRSRAFASPCLSLRFHLRVYFATSVSTQVLFINVIFLQLFCSFLACVPRVLYARGTRS